FFFDVELFLTHYCSPFNLEKIRDATPGYCSICHYRERWAGKSNYPVRDDTSAVSRNDSSRRYGRLFEFK
ncbi:MAG: hypothetical protein N6V49_03545, partial [Serratia symbiotica]|nr:hypothetical protein [Serratia symbiotica]